MEQERVNFLFETLERKGLLTSEGIQKTSVEALSSSEIFELTETILEICSTPEYVEHQTIFSHSASLSLSGTTEDCSSIGCREARVEELTRFALMYSDCVYAKNLFSDYEHLKVTYNASSSPTKEDYLRSYFHDDLYIINRLRPLLEAGFIKLFTPPNHSCPACIANNLFGSKSDDRLLKQYMKLKREYFLNTTVKADKRGARVRFRCEADENYIEHGGLFIVHNEVPKEMATMTKLLNKLDRGETITLSQAARKKLKLHEYLAGRVLKNIKFDLIAAQVLRTSFLTQKPLHIAFLNSISNNQDVEERNSIAYKHLTSFVPFVDDVEIGELIKLRNREEEAFIRYRRALNEAIDEFRAGGARFSEKDAKVLYSDVIAPRISALESSIKDAKKDLVKKPAVSVAALVGAVSFGLYAGFLPHELTSMAKALGATKVLYDILDKTMALTDTEKTIRNEDLYFLWRVKRKSED